MIRKTVRLTLRDGLRAQYQRGKGHLLLVRLDGGGRGGGGRLPLRAMAALMDAVEVASLLGIVRVEDLPTVSGVLDVDEVRVGLVPKAGVAMHLTLADGRRTVVLVRSGQGEAVLRRAADRIGEGLALAVRGHAN